VTGLRRLLIACHQLTLLGANLIHRKDPLSDPSDCTTQKEDIMFTKLLSRIQQRARCMADMMARLHIDPVDASRVRSGAGLAAAWRRCLACGSGKDCAAWLDGAASEWRGSAVLSEFWFLVRNVRAACILAQGVSALRQRRQLRRQTRLT